MMDMREPTLDPQDPEAFRALAHRMLDDTLDHLYSLRDRPAWQPMPAAVRASFDSPVPWDGEGEASAYEAFAVRVRPYPNGCLHPRFSGWVQGNGTPLAALAEMMAAALNPHLAGFDQAPALVEHEVLRWLAELMGMPGASGILVSGGTLANTLGLAVARHALAGFDVRADGLQGAPARLVFYGSVETHGWAGKAAEFLGLGRRSFRQVPALPDFRIDPQALRAAIARDRAEGLKPFCVVGTAGTINTGAIDDLDGLADICTEHGLWFHVDGAFGALARLSDALRPLVHGMERADSLGFDLHKWGSLPFECACTLVRDPALHEAAFSLRASYLTTLTRGVIAGGLPFADRGLDLTRSFRALKVWLTFKAYGVRRIAAVIDKNVAQAAYLAERVRTHPCLELLAPVPLNVVCFRYVRDGMDERQLEALNREILAGVQERGIAVPSSTVINGRFAIRSANVNHRALREDIDALVDGVVALGGELAG